MTESHDPSPPGPPAPAWPPADLDRGDDGIMVEERDDVAMTDPDHHGSNVVSLDAGQEWSLLQRALDEFPVLTGQAPRLPNPDVAIWFAERAASLQPGISGRPWWDDANGSLALISAPYIPGPAQPPTPPAALAAQIAAERTATERPGSADHDRDDIGLAKPTAPAPALAADGSASRPEVAVLTDTDTPLSDALPRPVAWGVPELERPPEPKPPFNPADVPFPTATTGQIVDLTAPVFVSPPDNPLVDVPAADVPAAPDHDIEDARSPDLSKFFPLEISRAPDLIEGEAPLGPRASEADAPADLSPGDEVPAMPVERPAETIAAEAVHPAVPVPPDGNPSGDQQPAAAAAPPRRSLFADRRAKRTERGGAAEINPANDQASVAPASPVPSKTPGKAADAPLLSGDADAQPGGRSRDSDHPLPQLFPATPRSRAFASPGSPPQTDRPAFDRSSFGGSSFGDPGFDRNGFASQTIKRGQMDRAAARNGRGPVLPLLAAAALIPIAGAAWWWFNPLAPHGIAGVISAPKSVIVAPADGRVTQIMVSTGSRVSAATDLLVIEAPPPDERRRTELAARLDNAHIRADRLDKQIVEMNAILDDLRTRPADPTTTRQQSEVRLRLIDMKAQKDIATSEAREIEQTLADDAARPHGPQTVKAGIDALVWSIEATEGIDITRGLPLVELADCQRIAVTLQSRADGGPDLRPGNAVRVRIGGSGPALTGTLRVRGSMTRGEPGDTASAQGVGQGLGAAPLQVEFNAGELAKLGEGSCPIGKSVTVVRE